jgi:hypothetical protein
MSELAAYVNNTQITLQHNKKITKITSITTLEKYLETKINQQIRIMVDNPLEQYEYKEFNLIKTRHQNRLKKQITNTTINRAMLGTFKDSKDKNKYSYLGVFGNKDDFIYDVIQTIFKTPLIIKEIHCASLVYQDITKKIIKKTDANMLLYPFSQDSYRLMFVLDDKLINSAVVSKNDITLQEDRFVLSLSSEVLLKRYCIGCVMRNYKTLAIKNISDKLGLSLKNYNIKELGLNFLSLHRPSHSLYNKNIWSIPYIKQKFFRLVYKIAIIVLVTIIGLAAYIFTKTHLQQKENAILQKELKYKKYQYEQKLTEVISPSKYNAATIKNTVQLYDLLADYSKTQPIKVFEIIANVLDKYPQISIKNLKFKQLPQKINFNNKTKTMISLSGDIGTSHNNLINLDNNFKNFIQSVQKHPMVLNTVVVQQPFTTKTGLISNLQNPNKLDFVIEIFTK